MQLLVSVRSVEEADLAAESGIEWIDLKEPRDGSLGATSHHLWKAVVSKWHTQARISLALGELSEMVPVHEVPEDTDRVKVGLAGCRHTPDWQARLRGVFDRLPRGVQRVAVHYADAHKAESPSLDDVFHMALEHQCSTFLVDTFDKSGGSVFDYLSTTQLKTLRQRLHDQGVQLALAGSLRRHHLRSVVEIQPAIVAVRGAVCHHDRTGSMDAELLRSLHSQLQNANHPKVGNVLSSS